MAKFGGGINERRDRGYKKRMVQILRGDHPQPRPSSHLLIGRSPSGRRVALYALVPRTRGHLSTDWWAGPATEHGSPTSCVRNQPMTRSLRCSSSLALMRIMLKKPRRPSSLAAPHVATSPGP